jgi:hypothetical protein
MTLEEAKQRLSRKYLGKDGIHGIGLSRSQNAVRVHLIYCRDPEQTARQGALLNEMKQDAAPYVVLLTFEEAPMKSETVSTEQVR